MSITNMLQQFSAGPSGQVATIVSQGKVSGPEQDATAQEIFTGTLLGQETATWKFSVLKGLFLGDTLTQTSSSIGMDQAGTGQPRHRSVTETHISQMHLVSVTHSVAGSFLLVSPLTVLRTTNPGLTLHYPTSWHRAPVASGSVEVDSGDGNATVYIDVISGTNAAILSPEGMATFLRAFGVVQSPPTYHVVTQSPLGYNYVVADALLTTPTANEMQLEVRIIPDGDHFLVVVGAAVPEALYGQRPNSRFAREYEQVHTALNSLTLAAPAL